MAHKNSRWLPAWRVLAALLVPAALSIAAGVSLGDERPSVDDLRAILRSDQDGHFVVSGFGGNVDPEDVKFSCSKDGLKELGSSKQVTGEGTAAVIEVNCILGPP